MKDKKKKKKIPGRKALPSSSLWIPYSGLSRLAHMICSAMVPCSNLHPTPDMAGWKNQSSPVLFLLLMEASSSPAFQYFHANGSHIPTRQGIQGRPGLFPEKPRTTFLVLLPECIKTYSRLWWTKANISHLIQLKYELVLLFNFVSLAESWNHPHLYTRNCSSRHAR